MSYRIIQLEQGSSGWLEYRRNKITATDTAKIMNLSPFCTPLMLWEEKLGLREPKPENNDMREGKRLEEEARKFVNEKCPHNNFRPVVLQSTTHPFMMVSLDGFDDNRGDPIPRVLEIKCGKKSHELALKGEIPAYYMAQLQKQIFVAQVSKISYLSYRSDDDTYEITVRRDDAFIEKMIEAETDFYRRMIEFDPPPATDSDYEIKDSKEWRMSAAVLKEARQQLKKYSQIEEDAKKALIMLSEGKSCKGHGIKVRKSVRKGTVDYSSIEILKTVNLDDYRKKSVEYYSITDG